MKCQGERSLRLRRPGGCASQGRKAASGFPVARSREEKRRGRRTEAIIRKPPLGAFLRQGDHGSRPAACGCIGAQAKTLLGHPSGGAKVTPDQIAEAQRMASEWKPK